MIDATKPTNTHDPLRAYGAALIAVASVLLPIGFLLRRISFANTFEVPIFDDRFLLFIILMIAVVLLLLWVIQRSWLQRQLEARPRLLTGLVIISGFLAYRFALSNPSLRTYSAVVAAYALACSVGVLLVGFGNSRTQIQWRQVRQAVGLVLLGVALPLLLLESGMRLYFSVFGTLPQKVSYLYSVDEALAISNRYIPQPYVNYMPSPNFTEHNGRGYRGDPLQTPKAAETFRIFALGGSTTYGTQLDPQETYPAQLERILHETYGYTHVEVVNAGAEVYTTYDSMATLLYRVLDDAPDMILIYHGINDVRARLVDPARYSGLNAERGQWSTATLQSQIPPSTLARFVQVQLGYGPNLLDIETYINATSSTARCGIGEAFCTRLNMPALDVLSANPPIYFERNLRNMVAVARANSVVPIFSTWDYYPEDVLPNPNFMASPHLQVGVAEQNELLLQLAAELDVPIFELNMPDEPTHWQDGMHMTAAGTLEQATQFAAFLVEQDVLPLP